MKEYIKQEYVFPSMDLDCLILNPAFINKKVRGSKRKVTLPEALERPRSEKRSVSDEGAILKVVAAAAVIFAVALFI